MTSQSLPNRLLAAFVRPTARPLGAGIVVAVCLLIGEILVVLGLKRLAPDNAFGAIFLLGVLIVSAGWNLGLAIATSLASTLVYVYFHLEGHDTLAPSIIIFLTLALLANVLANQARLRTAEAEERRREAAGLAGQQAALRRVATLVARGAPPEDVYRTAVDELAQSLDAQHVTLLLFEPGEVCEVLATCDRAGVELSVGEKFSLGGDSISSRILRTAEPARIDDYSVTAGELAERLQGLGTRSGVGAPLIVDGAVRGSLIVAAQEANAIPDGTEAHICDFADLVATAIANAETRAELTASRARIVAAADQARRGFERDLHDGAQQRIVSLSLELRAIEAAAAEPELQEQLGKVVGGLGELYTDLQELSRGLHPAILSKGGLGPAIKTLARRSPVPVELDLDVDGRLPESVEVAAYYVVAECLTNAAKHANAEVVTVAVTRGEDAVRLTVRDDGDGGAAPGGGSGLVGLRDRVEALSGELAVVSHPGDGTTVSARIPVPA
ncbi:Histidine kinase-, DNA gyrase B-, and HSP90-like ATPase [Mycolicibacterium rutilum]|uniref:histidine kinase n=1 Tax=Mycolicibacterium rutilum TaxID=370526 RepID=A0A1H6LGK1_MYCRU|nr:ATP-binding protein [Mycolicibacterium rutilum]SEH87566.1 Histidine kinase-, DNA gyrase B-, and HSP90-like ATPase [Mycolicibacterium rutilum]